MLICLHVVMRPLHRTWFNLNSARSMHGLFFAMLRKANRDLADRLHPSNTTDSSIARASSDMAFTCSDIDGEFELHRDGKWSLPDRTYTVRITAYEPSVCAALNSSMTGSTGNSVQGMGIEIRGQPWEITDCIIKPRPGSSGSHVCTFESILADAQAEDRIELKFVSPTAINKSVPRGSHATGEHQLFPTPESIFRKYQLRWNAHATSKFESVDSACLSGAVVVDRYELSTRLFAYEWGVPLRGFVGTCSYRIRTSDPSVRRQLNALADFAYFAGTGIKTTQGMGQTRRVALERHRTRRDHIN